MKTMVMNGFYFTSLHFTSPHNFLARYAYTYSTGWAEKRATEHADRPKDGTVEKGN